MSTTGRGAKASYQCSACGARPLKWSGRCGQCGQWGTVEEVAPVLA
ncbi:MAG: hypothetical protein LBG11_04560, partial [Bifidobacteriaceae bacterium]|nr:hypothetical protein [Bifidobacteriaceae bacterium]